MRRPRHHARLDTIQPVTRLLKNIAGAICFVLCVITIVAWIASYRWYAVSIHENSTGGGEVLASDLGALYVGRLGALRPTASPTNSPGWGTRIGRQTSDSIEGNAGLTPQRWRPIRLFDADDG